MLMGKQKDEILGHIEENLRPRPLLDLLKIPDGYKCQFRPEQQW
jgi:hypothetical protein